MEQTFVKRVYPEDFQDIKDCTRPFELLARERIRQGDRLVLLEFDPLTRQLTGRRLMRRVLSVTAIDLTAYFSLVELARHELKIVEI